MAEVTPRTYIYGIIMMMFFVIGGMGIMSEYTSVDADFDSSDKSGEFNRTFNKIDDVTASIDELETNIQEADENLGFFGVLNALIFSSWQAIKFIFTSFGFMDGVIEGLSSFFGVPQWIPLVITLLITTMLIFAIFKMVFQSE